MGNLINKNYVSYSEVLTYEECPFKWKLRYIDGYKQDNTIYNIFGNALHEAINRRTTKGIETSWITMVKTIYKWILKNPVPNKWITLKKAPNEWVTEKGYLNPRGWGKAALIIYSQIFEWLFKEFGKYKIIGSEIRLKEPMDEINEEFYFRGYIDLLIRDSKENYHLIDFKTTDWGWDKNKRKDIKKQYQIILYKKFACEKFKLNRKKVKTHFILLKRSPPKKTNAACELITVSSNDKKIEDATKWVTKNIQLMKKGLIIKKRTGCKFCEFYKTTLCP